MLTVPNLPTDNLYKFVALSGLSLIIFSLAVFEVRGSALSDKLDQITVEQAVLDAELKHNAADLALAERKSHLSPDDAKALVHQTQEVAVRAATSGARATINGRLAREQKVLAWVTSAGVGVGMALAVVGFTLWYRRVQIFQDQLLRNQK